jgi:ElaB/YqjD/DUF883 family membrane-anchored ribosome-binding protein
MAEVTVRSEDERTTPSRAEVGRAPARAEPVGPAVATGNGRPSSLEEMRAEIEATRIRMSSTLDDIEDRLVRQKRDLWAKATFQGFRRKVSSEPWRSLAIAFVAGYIVAAIRD